MSTIGSGTTRHWNYNELSTVEVLDTEGETVEKGPSMNFEGWNFTAYVVGDTTWVDGSGCWLFECLLISYHSSVEIHPQCKDDNAVVGSLLHDKKCFKQSYFPPNQRTHHVE